MQHSFKLHSNWSVLDTASIESCGPLKCLSLCPFVCPLPSARQVRWGHGNNEAIRRFVITEKAPTRAFSWLKAATTAFTIKTLLRHYAKRALTARSLNVKLGPLRNYHKGRAAIRHYANQTARPLWLLHRGPNFTLRDRGVNACLA